MSDARNLIEAETPKSVFKQLIRARLPKAYVRIALQPKGQDDWHTVRVPVKWENETVLGPDGWMAGITLRSAYTPAMPGITGEAWTNMLELVEYHLMEGDQEAPSDQWIFDGEDMPEEPEVQAMSWKFIGPYTWAQCQQEATAYFRQVDSRRSVS